MGFLPAIGHQVFHHHMACECNDEVAVTGVKVKERTQDAALGANDVDGAWHDGVVCNLYHQFIRCLSDHVTRYRSVIIDSGSEPHK